MKFLTRIRLGCHRDFLSVANPRQVDFVRIKMHPQQAQIGDRINTLAQANPFALLF